MLFLSSPGEVAGLAVGARLERLGFHDDLEGVGGPVPDLQDVCLPISVLVVVGVDLGAVHHLGNVADCVVARVAVGSPGISARCARFLPVLHGPLQVEEQGDVFFG